MGHGCECLLAEQQEVPYQGPDNADVFFVGESPGYQEVRAGSPFVSKAPSGKKLTFYLFKNGIDRADVFVANSAKCLIDKSILTRKQIKVVLTSCRPFLTEAIHRVKPKLIVCLGDIALEQVLKKRGIRDARGKFFWSSEFNAHVLPTWHPGYILRNPTEERNFEIDFNKIRAFVKNNFKIPSADTFYSWKEVDSIRPLLKGGFYKEDERMITALDTETQGRLWYDPNSIVISYSVAASLMEGWQVYLHEECDPEESHFTITAERGGQETLVGVRRVKDFNRKVEELRELCSRKDIKKYFMNQKYDVHRLWNLGITELENAPMDIAVAAHATDAQRFTYPSLASLFETFTGEISHKEEVSKAEKGDMLLTAGRDREKVTKYASLDAVTTLQAALKVRSELLKDKVTANYFINFCMPIETKFLFMLERFGIPVDWANVPKVRHELETLLKKEETTFKKFCGEKILEEHGKDFRLTKRSAIMDMLFKYSVDGVVRDLGFGIEPPSISPKSRLPSTDKKTMRILLDSSIPANAKKAIRAFLKWNEYYVLDSRYITNILKLASYNTKMHPSYTLTATSSGRTGAKDPSIQNFPKRSDSAKLIRKLIVAPEGMSLIEADYSNSELRWIAHVANEKNMKHIFKNDGDIHLETGLVLTRTRREELTDPKKIKELRQNSKPVNFGISYMMSATGLQDYARTNYGIKMTIKQAANWRSSFLYELYPAVPVWHDWTERFVLENKYIRHAFGRKFSLPNIDSDSPALHNEAIRLAVNLQIQGPSSDMTLLGGWETVNDPEFSFKEAKPIIFIHDALGFLVQDQVLDKYLKIIKYRMEHVDTSKFGFKFSLPLKVDLKVGKNLAEMKEVKVEG